MLLFQEKTKLVLSVGQSPSAYYDGLGPPGAVVAPGVVLAAVPAVLLRALQQQQRPTVAGRSSRRAHLRGRHAARMLIGEPQDKVSR